MKKQGIDTSSNVGGNTAYSHQQGLGMKSKGAFSTLGTHYRNKQLAMTKSISYNKNNQGNNIDYYVMFSRALMQNEDIIPNSQECIEEIGKINNDFNLYQSTISRLPERIVQSREEKEEKVEKAEKAQVEEIIAQKAKNELIVGPINITRDNEASDKETNNPLNVSKGKKKKKDNSNDAEDSEETRKLKARQALKQKRRRALNSALAYLESNCILLSEYLTNNPFQSKPFQLPYSTDFIKAVKFGELDTVRSAIQMNLRFLFTIDHFHQTGFHWAAKLGNFDMLVVLLSAGKNCNMFDHHERTPLYLAVLNGHYKCCTLLLENFANPFLADSEGKKPIDVATDQKIQSLLAMNMDGVYRNTIIREKIAGLLKLLEDKKLKKAVEAKLFKERHLANTNTNQNEEEEYDSNR